MSDRLFQNEPIAANREVVVELFNQAGTARVSGAASGATIKICLPGGNWSTDAGCTLTEVTGGADAGPYRLRLSASAVSLVGDVGWEISNGSTIAIARGSVSVRPLDCQYYGKVSAVPSSTTLNLDSTSPGGSAVLTNNYYASFAAGRVAIVRVVAGAGANQVRTAIDYQVVTGSGQITLDSSFTTPVDTTSIIRLEYCAPSAAAIASTVLTSALGAGRTVQGALRRMDWINIGKMTGGLSTLATFFQYDGTTIGVQAAQDPVGGTRTAASTAAGD